MRERFASPSARPWYVGSLVGLLWMGIPIVTLWSGTLPLGLKLLGQVLLAVWSVVYVALPPQLWMSPVRIKVLAASALFVSTLVFVPFLSDGVTSLWVFVAISLGMTRVPMGVAAAFSGAIALLLLAVGALTGPIEQAFYFPLVTFSIAMMMAAFARQIDLVHRLRDSQAETARLATEQERGRVARDIHDILGHSLTVITVKAELAGRLIDDHPDRAATEITDIERLARGALADVRATVSGYREISLAAELIGAQAALDSAGIEAHLPNSVDTVRGDHRELFAWVIREGTTNVIRHAQASQCTITLAADAVSVLDDGTGPVESLHPGNGLSGLRERVEAAGASLSIGRSPSGGFALTVTS